MILGAKLQVSGHALGLVLEQVSQLKKSAFLFFTSHRQSHMERLIQ